jgi:hypothetical protein
MFSHIKSSNSENLEDFILPKIGRVKINTFVLMPVSLGYCFSVYITPYISIMSKSESQYLRFNPHVACGTDREALDRRTNKE